MVFHNLEISGVNEVFIRRQCPSWQFPDSRDSVRIQPEEIGLHAATFELQAAAGEAFRVHLRRQGKDLHLACSCNGPTGKLCEHGARVLYQLTTRNDLRLFFDDRQRHDALRKFATPYGLQHEPDPDEFFVLAYEGNKLGIRPRAVNLFAVTSDTTRALQQQVLRDAPALPRTEGPLPAGLLQGVVLRQHRFYHHLCLDLFEGATTREAKLRNPLRLLEPQDFLWKASDGAEIKFFTGLCQFRNNHTTPKTAQGLEALKAVVKNPRGLQFFGHNQEGSDNIVAAALEELKMAPLLKELTVKVNRRGSFYEATAQVRLQQQVLDLAELPLCYDYFLRYQDTLYLPATFHLLKLVEFFRQHHYSLLIHESKFEAFRKEVLDGLGERVPVRYTWLQPATKEQAVKAGLTASVERILYLSDMDNYILLEPVVKYGTVEVPVFSRRQVQATDATGNLFFLPRDTAAEDAFVGLLLRQHPLFAEQLEEELPYFYLHRDRFLAEDWFLEAFDAWQQGGIAIYGFNKLKGNKLNPHKAKVTVQVRSGINWFDTDISVRFGGKKAGLKQLQKAVRNRSRYVQLDDGSQGILPLEWMEKFAAWFQAGEVLPADLLRTPKINYAAVEELYDPHFLDPQVLSELALLQEKLSRFEAIEEVPLPEGLTAELRPYQHQGLSWLAFLDHFNFGGCLADDMGLGKSVQVLAFVLLQRQKMPGAANLLVAPASLIFNWQAEVRKFAPSLKIVTQYGPQRARNTAAFAAYDLVLTSYGTLLSDVDFLKKYTFNYIFLDESQNIKNPDSQRYRAARLLQARNRLVITGTPLENNTFDLYGQLSFACPGLLGDKRYFRDVYANPIDNFKESRRARELQQRIAPFILRRTKAQVATELPDKTEMVQYCEMGPAQREIYERYEKELRDFLESKSEEDLPKSGMHVLRGLTRLRQICNSPLLLQDETLYGDTSAKIGTLLEQVENKAPYHKILVFSQFVSMLQLIRKELDARGIGYELLTGSTRNREAAVTNFQTDENVRVFLVSLKAGGTGLNLTEAEYVYLVDPWWNPAVENQAIDRCYRIGQHNNVVAVRFICPGTIEEKMLKLQTTKRELAEGLVRTDASIFKSLTKRDLVNLLGGK
ncbi:SNF2-related protein [Paraflavisolibacter sp. H34]|uniref:DEAD/DEAH box helicase n=1 Tax=Huijunlia imazamoxiresistens TaxID=3127457 RepID=UPI0030189715